MLGNLLDLPGCEYESADAIRDELRERVAAVPEQQEAVPERLAPSGGARPADAELDVPIYRVDALVRRARALQLTVDGRSGRVGLDERRIA